MNDEFVARLLALFAEYGISLPEPPPATDGPFGFSAETTEYGGRSHPLVDGFLAEAQNGDAVERRIAQTMPKYFVFSNGRFPDMLPDDPKAAKLAEYAYSIQHVPLGWESGNTKVVVGDFRVELDKPIPEKNKYFHIEDSHGVAVIPTTMTPDVAIRAYLAQKREQVQYQRDNGPPRDWWSQQ